jgi:ABC-2 type transport system permease protein
MNTTARIVRYAFLSGARDYGSIYTPTTWLAGWFLRVLAQVTFFALLGRLLQSEQQTWFLLVGNSVMLAAMEGVWAVNMVSWERNAGTLPLLVASPTNPVVVLASRGTYLIADGVLSALGALFLLGLLFGLPMPWPRVLLVVPLTVLVAASAYCLGTFLGGVLLGYRSLNNIAANVGLVTVMTLCGVNVPLSAYPEPIAWVSRLLPMTNGLIAIREVFDGRLAAAGLHALIEAAVGLGWLGACLVTFGWFIARGRRTGSLEYAT